MATSVTASTTYEATTHGAVSKPATAAAPRPPAPSSTNPMYMTWLPREDRPRSAATTARSRSPRIRNATHIETAWQSRNTTKPTRCSRTSQAYMRRGLPFRGCRRDDHPGSRVGAPAGGNATVRQPPPVAAPPWVTTRTSRSGGTAQSARQTERPQRVPDIRCGDHAEPGAMREDARARRETAARDEPRREGKERDRHGSDLLLEGQHAGHEQHLEHDDRDRRADREHQQQVSRPPRRRPEPVVQDNDRGHRERQRYDTGDVVDEAERHAERLLAGGERGEHADQEHESDAPDHAAHLERGGGEGGLATPAPAGSDHRTFLRKTQRVHAWATASVIGRSPLEQPGAGVPGAGRRVERLDVEPSTEPVLDLAGQQARERSRRTLEREPRQVCGVTRKCEQEEAAAGPCERRHPGGHPSAQGRRQVVEGAVIDEQVERALDAGHAARREIAADELEPTGADPAGARRVPRLAQRDAREVDAGDVEPSLGELDRDAPRTTAQVDRPRSR